MDPQQTPNDQPAQTPTPAPPVSDAPSPQPAPPVSQGLPAEPAGSSKRLLYGTIAGAVVVVAILAASWFLYFSPAAQSKRLSNSFMSSITSGDVDKAVELSGDDSAKAFLTTAGKSVHGSYKMSQSEFKDGKGYYLYALTGADRKYARTIIAKDNGKRVVSSFVYSNTALALVPSSAAASGLNGGAAPEPAPTATTTSGCLAPDDFSYFSDVNTTPTPYGNGGYEEFYQIGFSPNVATYAPGGTPDPTAVFNDFKKFYAQDGSSKQYTIELESSVNSSAPDEDLANARNAKVQSDLETISGIPASKITIQPITNDTSGNSAADAFFRQVQITLKSAGNCAS